jgi:hypothetical protein
MKIPFPLGWAVALVLPATQALAQTLAPPILPDGALVVPQSSPPTSFPTRPPVAATTPVPGVSPARPVGPAPTNVAAPQTAPVLAPPPVPPELPNASGPLNREQELKAVPLVEIWRAGAARPQTPRRRGHHLGRGFIAGPAPVFVQLHFDPSKVGKTIAVTVDPGVTCDPPKAFLRVPPTGDCGLTVRLDESFHEGSMTFSCSGVTSVLHLSHAPASLVESLETSNPPGGQ